MRIKITGAGLSGLSCALNLAKAGIDVDVFEKEECVGKKYGISILAFKAYNNDIIDKLENANIPITDLYPIYKIRRYSPNMNYFEVYSDTPQYYSVVRGVEGIEYSIMKKCEQKGVNFYFSSTIEQADVVATGARFTHFIGVSKTFETDGRDYISIFHSPLSPGGYLYIIPHKKYITAGAVFDASRVLKPVDRFNQFFSSFEFSEPIHSMISKANYFYLNPTHQLCVGEAAGLLEPSRGFGMEFAILSGKIAADSIAFGYDYSQQLQGIINRMQDGLKMRKFYSSITAEDYEKIISFFGKRISVGEYIQKKKEIYMNNPK